MEADLWEQAHAKRFSMMEERLLTGSKKLDPLVCSGTVVVQNQVAEKTGKPGRWTKTGEVVEVLPFDSYLVLIHGSRSPTQTHRISLGLCPREII